MARWLKTSLKKNQKADRPANKWISKRFKKGRKIIRKNGWI